MNNSYWPEDYIIKWLTDPNNRERVYHSVCMRRYDCLPKVSELDHEFYRPIGYMPRRELSPDLTAVILCEIEVSKCFRPVVVCDAKSKLDQKKDIDQLKRYSGHYEKYSNEVIAVIVTTEGVRKSWDSFYLQEGILIFRIPDEEMREIKKMLEQEQLQQEFEQLSELGQTRLFEAN